jgi:hypothetical protein
VRGNASLLHMPTLDAQSTQCEHSDRYIEGARVKKDYETPVLVPSVLARMLRELDTLTPAMLAEYRQTQLPVQENEMFALAHAKMKASFVENDLMHTALKDLNEAQACLHLDAALRLTLEQRYLLDVVWTEIEMQCEMWQYPTEHDMRIRQGDLFVVVMKPDQVANLSPGRNQTLH